MVDLHPFDCSIRNLFTESSQDWIRANFSHVVNTYLWTEVNVEIAFNGKRLDPCFAMGLLWCGLTCVSTRINNNNRRRGFWRWRITRKKKLREGERRGQFRHQGLLIGKWFWLGCRTTSASGLGASSRCRPHGFQKKNSETLKMF